MRWGLVIAGLVTLMPLAAGASVGGLLDVRGSVHIPVNATMTSAPATLYAGEFASGTLDGQAPAAIVRVFEFRYVTADAIVARPSIASPVNRTSTWPLTEATFEITGVQPGWVGIRPVKAQLVESNMAATRVTAVAEGNIGNGMSRDSPQDPWFAHPLESPHLDRDSDSWTLSGGSAIKIFGPTIRLEARENTTTIETGEMPDPETPALTIRRWVIIEHEQGVVTGRDARTRIVSPDLHAQSDGAIQLSRATGSLRDLVQEWEAVGGPATVEGTFEAALSPSGRDAIILTLQGDLRSTTMTSRVAVPAPSSAGTLGFLIIVGVAVGAATSGYVVRRRYRASLEADELATLADQAADREDYTRAKELMRRARRLSPTSRRLALDQAYFTAQGGDKRLALRLLEEPLIRHDADALILATRLHIQMRDLTSAEVALVRALEAAPIVALDIEGDPTFDELAERRLVRAALRNARRRIE